MAKPFISGRQRVAYAGSKGTPLAILRELNAAVYALNNFNLDLPNNNQSSSAFGRITTACDPRILQFAVRVAF
jgi:hypothetical protein